MPYKLPCLDDTAIYVSFLDKTVLFPNPTWIINQWHDSDETLTQTISIFGRPVTTQTY